MHYKKTEEYQFYIPREYKAFLAFKDRLTEMGVKYYVESGHMIDAVRIYTHGDFEVDDKCDVMKMTKES